MALNEQGKIVTKSFARSRITSSEPPSQCVPMEFEEMCCLCGNYMPHGQLVLRHRVSDKVICILCIVAIAEVE